MPTGGRLLLETANTEVRPDYVRLHLGARAGEYIRLRVEDTGHGIPPEVRARIFEPFFTTKGPGEGTGLGLAMVFGNIQQHGGWIECSCEVNRGTRFDLYLPRHGQADEPPAPAASQQPASGNETILLADDEAMLRHLGEVILRRYGYRVLLAEDGQQAVEIYGRSPEAIDLVVLDLTMPRLSGRDAFRKMREINPGVRVLFASGYTAESLTDTDQVLGFVSKPYRPDGLASSIRAALDQGRVNPACGFAAPRETASGKRLP
jgi:CheY-like chemotaxis protein